jgi:hypothetical protein
MVEREMLVANDGESSNFILLYAAHLSCNINMELSIGPKLDHSMCEFLYSNAKNTLSTSGLYS